MLLPERMRFGVVLLALITFLSALPMAWSQEVTANIVGTIKDPSGAPVPGVTVIATDTARGTVYSAKTNDVGAYNISRIKVGSYTLKASAPGSIGGNHGDAGNRRPAGVFYGAYNVRGYFLAPSHRQGGQKSNQGKKDNAKPHPFW